MVNVLISLAVSLVVTILAMGLIVAMQRRGWDPVARIGAFLSPRDERQSAAAEEVIPS